MSVSWKKVEFYKGKSNCKAIVILQCGSRAEPLWGFRGKAPKIIWLFHVFKALKQHTVGLKKLDLRHYSGLSMNILRVGDQSPVQRGFFKNSAGDLLPALRFLGGLYNFCNFAIIFSLL